MPTDKMTLAWLLEHAFDNNQNGEIVQFVELTPAEREMLTRPLT